MLNQKTSQMKRNNIKTSYFLFLLLALSILFSADAVAQYIEKYPISSANGNKMLDMKNYQEAIRQYKSLLNKDPSNVNYKFKLAKSYTYSNIDKAKGLEILRELNELAEPPNGTKYELGVSLYNNYKFDESKTIFLNLKETTEDAEEKNKMEEWIQQIEFAKNLYASPINVTFENLGKYVNSKAPDYLPITNPNESILIFTSRRVGVVGNLYDFRGYKTADIFLSKHKRNKYSRARSIGSPNTYGNEQTAGRSENGQYITYNINSGDFFNDLFVSKKGKRSFMPPKEVDSKTINQKSNEMGASLSNDGSVMFFCSDRDGGLGGFDIYKVIRLPNGNWSEPKNVGAPINTSKDEKYPQLEDEGKLLYFSSNGHYGMGNMDVFKSNYDSISQKWLEPENLGYPINTTGEDLNISFAKNKRYAYVSAKRADSYGDLDIYRLTFEDMRDDYTLLTGRVMDSDSLNIDAEITVEIFDINEESLYGSYVVNNKTGKYSAILPVGKYRIEVLEMNGFEDFEKEIKLLGKNDFQNKRNMDLMLTKSQ